jgi:hypothetical protein
MGALPKRKISTRRGGKRQAALKKRFLRMALRQLSGIQNKK